MDKLLVEYPHPQTVPTTSHQHLFTFEYLWQLHFVTTVVLLVQQWKGYIFSRWLCLSLTNFTVS
jgi:hypothetical protein